MWSILKLEVDEAQKQFVATNTESIIEAYTTIIAGGIALPFGIYDDDTPVGFLMIGYGEIPEDENPKVAKENYCIWRFMIDKNYQGRGYAKKRCVLPWTTSKPFPAEKQSSVIFRMSRKTPWLYAFTTPLALRKTVNMMEVRSSPACRCKFGGNANGIIIFCTSRFL